MAYSPNIASADLPVGLDVSGFSSVGGQVASQKIIRSLYDYDPFAIYQAVAQRHSEMPGFRMMLRMQDAARRVSAPTTGHYEQDWKTSLVNILSVVTPSGGAGQTAVLELATTSMYNAGATIGGSARQASFVRVGDVLQSPGGVAARVEAKTTSTTPHRITIKPLLTADDVAGEFAANETYAIFSNMWAEGSGLPESVVPRITKYTNSFQIIKDGAAITGTELTNKTFVQWTAGQDGSIFVEMEKSAMYRYERATCYALLFGVAADNLTENSTSVGHDVSITGTQGLIPFIEGNGHVDTYTVGSYDISDFDQTATLLRQERVGTWKITTYDGYGIFQETENALQDLLNANLSVELLKDLGKGMNVSGESMQPFEDSDFSFYVGFRALKKSGFTFYFHLLHEFDEVVGAGAAGYDYPNYRIAVPLGTATDKANGSNVPFVSYEYKGLNGYDRHDLVDQYGGVGTGPVVGRASNQYDLTQMGIVTELAGHFACPNRCVIQKPA